MKTFAAVFAVTCTAVSVGLLAARPAIADDAAMGDSVTETVHVSFADLDIHTDHGTKLLFMRLQDAARDVCGDSFGAMDLSFRLEIQRCQQTAIEHAVEQAGLPRLTQTYDRHYPRESIPDTRVSVRSVGEQELEVTARHG